MPFYTVGQAYVFLLTVYAGIFIGFLYDILRFARMLLYAGRWITALFDIVFWLIASALVLLTLFFANDGILRLYTILGFICGIFVYWGLFSYWCAHVFTRLSRFIHKGVKKMGRHPLVKKLMK